jgi:hypothetical protein
MSKHRHTDTHTVKGAGLARGPALVLGTILSLAGLALFLHAGDTPTGGFPDGDATGGRILGFEANGWTAFFTTTAGIVLLFAAAQHLLAKILGLIVGIALAAAAILAIVDGPGVLGLAAANWAVELGWGIAAVLLLLNVFAPRMRREHDAEAPRHTRVADHQAHLGATPAPVTGHSGSTGEHRTTTREDRVATGEQRGTTPGHDRAGGDRPVPASERTGDPRDLDGADRRSGRL